MNIKNNKGITLSTVIIAVILLIVIMSSIILSASKANETKRAMLLNNDIAELNRKVNLYYLQNGIVPMDENISIKIPEDAEDAEDEKNYNRLMIDVFENLNLNNKELIKKDDYGAIKTKDDEGNPITNKCYVINKETHLIYYVEYKEGKWEPVEYKYSEFYEELLGKADIEFGKEISETTIELYSPVFPQIGDYVNYIYDEAEDYVMTKNESGYSSNQTIPQTDGLKWRVIGVDDEENIELVSEIPTDTKMRFKGAIGYNNGVFLLNDICKEQYSNSNLEIIARSLNWEDFCEQFTDNVYAQWNAYDYFRGDIKEYSENNKYPVLYEKEIGSGVTGNIREGGISHSDSFYKYREDLTTDTYKTASNDNNNILKVTLSFPPYLNASNYFKNETFYSMLIEKKATETYWIATRVSISDGGEDLYCRWGIANLGNYGTTGSTFIYSNGSESTSGSYPLRPVVTIPADKYDLIQNEEDSSWDIYYKGTKNKVFE